MHRPTPTWSWLRQGTGLWWCGSTTPALHTGGFQGAEVHQAGAPNYPRCPHPPTPQPAQPRPLQCKHQPTTRPPRVFKAHDDWVEGLLNATTGPDPIDERVFSFSADGMVRMWELDAEQACDVYRLLVSYGAAERDVVARGRGLEKQAATTAIRRVRIGNAARASRV